MQAHSVHIENVLANHGWQIVTKENGSEWWADEIWTLRSVWSPVGTEAFITFLVDPQKAHSNRRKGEDVWAVMASPSQPMDRLEKSSSVTVALNSGWMNRVSELFEHLDTLRAGL